MSQINPPLPIAAAKLTFAYSDADDRLTLLATDAQGAGVHVALTRRLTGRLINGLAGLLERSNPIADKAPAELRDDIILLEHQDALFGHGGAMPLPTEAATSKTPSGLPAPRLLSAVDISVTPHAFQLRLREGQVPLIRLSLNRLAVHRLVEVLSRRAESAGWNITIDAAWLDPGQTEIVFN